MEKKESGHNKILQDKLDIIDEDKGIVMLKKGIVKEMIERMKRQGNKETSSIQTICKKMEKDIEKERDMIRKEKEDSLVNKGWKNDSSKKNDSLKEKIDGRLNHSLNNCFILVLFLCSSNFGNVS